MLLSYAAVNGNPAVYSGGMGREADEGDTRCFAD